MIRDKFIDYAVKASWFYIIVGAIVSFIITLDYKFPLGYLIGGLAAILGFRHLNKKISRIQFNENIQFAFVSGYLIRMSMYGAVLALAFYTDKYSFITTALGLFAIKVGFLIANKKVGVSS